MSLKKYRDSPPSDITPPGSLENSTLAESPPSSFGSGSPLTYAASVNDEIPYFLAGSKFVSTALVYL